MNKKLLMIGSIILICSIGVNACSSRPGISTPTLSMESVQTHAVATFASALTQTALALPTWTQTPTNTATPTLTMTPLPLQATGTSVLPTDSCYSLTFLSDITIPDNTEMKPGDQFTKIWRVRNSGSCIWDAGFRLIFTGGNPLGGATLILTEPVNPGSSTNLSVFLTAPKNTGSYQSNWRLSDHDGSFFGDEMYVIIKVVASTGTPASSSVPETLTPTETSLPEELQTETATP